MPMRVILFKDKIFGGVKISWKLKLPIDTTVEKYTAFVNQTTNLELPEQQAKLIEMRDCTIIKVFVRMAEDFTIDDKEKSALFFNEGDKPKRIWECIHASFNGQEILLMEPGYANHCADFDTLEKYQFETGYF